jgi:hypothetical protein
VKVLAAPLAVLVLGGCSSPRYPAETPGPERQARTSANTVTTNVFRSGYGTVETVNRSPSPPLPSAAAGGTSVRNDELLLRMDDGTRQVILLPAGSTRLNPGDRVEATGDRRIERR